MIREFLTLCLALGLLGLAVGLAAPANGQPTQTLGPLAERALPQILILNPAGYGRAVIDDFNRRFVATFQKNGWSTESLGVEYLDLIRNPGADYRHRKRDLLNFQYARRPISLIVTVTQPGLDFLLEELPDLSPQTPVLALNASPSAAQAKNRPMLSQVVQFDYLGTVRLALKLFPDTEHMLVLVGAAEVDQVVKKRLQGALANEPRLPPMEFTDQLSLDQLLDKVAHLPPRTVILDSTSLNRDAKGLLMAPYEVVAKVGARANAPVFDVVSAALNWGAVGGSVFDIGGEAERAAQLGLSLASGQLKVPYGVTDMAGVAVSMFDWQQLRRWGGNPDLLSADTVFINRPLSLWEAFRNEVIATALAFLSPTTLIVALLIQNRRRKLAEVAVRESETRFRVLVEQAPEAIIVYDVDQQRAVDVNAKAVALTGRSRRELMDIDYLKIYAAEQPDAPPVSDRFNEHAQQALQGDEVVFDRVIRDVDGNQKYCEVRVVRLPYAHRRMLRASYIDITDRKKNEALLETSLREKTILLQEIHHRVKNNLQIVISLLNLQASKTSNAEVVENIQSASARVQSMSLLHETLYRSSNLAHIAFGDYVGTFSRHLIESFGPRASKVDLELEIERVDFDLDRAVPCGLIINEAISNAIKHAFPPGARGIIKVIVARADEQTMRIAVSDNGVGMPAGLTVENAQTLGLELIALLVAKLRGTIEIRNESGTIVDLHFPFAVGDEVPAGSQKQPPGN